MRPRSAVLLSLAATLLGGGTALAHGGTTDAPRASSTVRPLFLSQEGCGETAEAGRLELKPRVDSATGCGIVAGLPLNEVFGSGDDYTSTKALGTVVLDGARKVTGQVAAGSWFGAGGVGTVEFDVTLAGRTASGKGIAFGTTTVSTSAEPAENVVGALFSFPVPKAAAGQKMTSFTLTVVQRGLNVGMTSKQLDGDSWVALPVKPVKR